MIAFKKDVKDVLRTTDFKALGFSDYDAKVMTKKSTIWRLRCLPKRCGHEAINLLPDCYGGVLWLLGRRHAHAQRTHAQRTNVQTLPS